MGPPHDDVLRVSAAALLAGLSLQYALGMYVNLFVSFPDNAGEEVLWNFAWTQWPLVSHILLALGLFIGAIVLCVLSARRRLKRWIWVSGVGLLAILAAGAFGGEFVGTQTEVYSYLMSLSFLIAAISYSVGLFNIRK